MKKRSWFKKFEEIEELLFQAASFEDLEKIEQIRKKVLSFVEVNEEFCFGEGRVVGGRSVSGGPPLWPERQRRPTTLAGASAEAIEERDWEIRSRRIKVKLFEKIQKKEQRLKWQWGRVGFAFISLVLVFGVNFLNPFEVPYLQASKFIFVEEVEGNVFVFRNGQKLDVTEGFELKSGDVLETGKESLAMVRFADDSIGKLEENTVLRVTEEKIKEGKSKVKAKLEKGKITAKVPKEVLKSELVVQVEDAQFSSNSLSEFVVSKENENVVVNVLGNEVLVSSEEGKINGKVYSGFSGEVLKENSGVDGEVLVVKSVDGENLVGVEKWIVVLDEIEVLDQSIEKKEKLRKIIKDFFDIVGRYKKDDLTLMEKRLIVSEMFDWKVGFENLFNDLKSGGLEGLGGGEDLIKFMIGFVEEELGKLEKIMPTDSLYNVRLSLEEVYLSLFFGDAKKILDVEYVFYNQRLDEIRRLLLKGKGNIVEKVISDLILKNAELNVKENFIIAEGKVDRSQLLRIYDAIASFSVIENSNYVKEKKDLLEIVENLKRNRLEYLVRYYREIGVENLEYAEVLRFRNVVVNLNYFDGMEDDLLKVAREIFVKTSERRSEKVMGVDELKEEDLLRESVATPERSGQIGQ